MINRINRMFKKVAMDTIDEETFRKLFAVGAVRCCDVHIREEGRAFLFYTLTVGETGYIVTKRGREKTYLVETALRFLHSIGFSSVRVDMSSWSLHQESLL